MSVQRVKPGEGKSEQEVPVKSYGYSRLFGTFYERGSALEARINAAKAALGETAVKQGFAGLQAGKREEVLGADLAKNPLMVGGNLKSVGLYKHQASGQEYVRVGFHNTEGRTFVSVALDSDLGKELVRKLASPALEVGKPLALQGIAFPKEVNGRTFVNHHVALWQGDKKIEGISVEPLIAEQNERRPKLEGFGIGAKTIGATLNALSTDWHRERLRKVIERVDEHYEVLAAARVGAADRESISEPQAEEDRDQGR